IQIQIFLYLLYRNMRAGAIPGCCPAFAAGFNYDQNALYFPGFACTFFRFVIIYKYTFLLAFCLVVLDFRSMKKQKEPCG
ncbi:hypothetical protein, partial [Christensenella hongkongensis]|uniref:hypothetical protein n=1 Tax=Christensenella hongkongensis TaxID=270498 RepID=UPI001A9A5FBF